MTQDLVFVRRPALWLLTLAMSTSRCDNGLERVCVCFAVMRESCVQSIRRRESSTVFASALVLLLVPSRCTPPLVAGDSGPIGFNSGASRARARGLDFFEV